MCQRMSEYKVYLFQNDYNTMCTEVYHHQSEETGGSLFGLWTTSGSAVIQVALGPGKQCRRTVSSFYQDVEYLERLGRFFNKKFMLCHIGEWHSHHHFSLAEPSEADVRTITNNYPRGAPKFLVMIANIVGGDRITLSPYFFTEGGKIFERAELKIMEKNSPFSSNEKIVKEILHGAEKKFINFSPKRNSRNSNNFRPACWQVDDEAMDTSGDDVSGHDEGLHDRDPPEEIQKLLREIQESIIGRDDSNSIYVTPGVRPEITFEHGNSYWIIRCHTEYPKEPAEVFVKTRKDNTREKPVVLHSRHCPGPQRLSSPPLIVNAIRHECACRACQEKLRNCRT